MKKFFTLFLGSLVCILYSCSSEEPIANNVESNNESIVESYKKYAREADINFSKSIKHFFGANSRGATNITTPEELGQYLSTLDTSELLALQENIKSSYPETESIIDNAYSNLIDSIGSSETIDYFKFCDQYTLSENKLELLESAVLNKPEKIRDTYIATAATIDNIGQPIASPIVDCMAVHVGGTGYYGMCEHQLVLDFAKMCVDDVLVEFWGGGPEDVAADITCGAGDLLSVINSVVSYIDCKKGK